MAVSPKLKQARAEIMDVLQRYNIAGTYYLHTITGESEENGIKFANGISEYGMHLEPTYSILKASEEGFRFRSKLAEYGGDKERQAKEVRETINMLEMIAQVQASHAMVMLELLDKLNAHYDTIGKDGPHRRHKG